MKKEFSTHWIGSRQPRKQRKYLANAPLHIKHKLMSAHLSKELRKKYGKRNFPIRKDDVVKVMRGEYKKKTGKIAEVNRSKMKVLIDGIYKSKKDGTKIKIYFQPSNLLIQELVLDDKKRLDSLNRKKIEAKPIKKIETKKEKASSLSAKRISLEDRTSKSAAENSKIAAKAVIETKIKKLNPSSKQSFEGHREKK